MHDHSIVMKRLFLLLVLVLESTWAGRLGDRVAECVADNPNDITEALKCTLRVGQDFECNEGEARRHSGVPGQVSRRVAAMMCRFSTSPQEDVINDCQNRLTGLENPFTGAGFAEIAQWTSEFLVDDFQDCADLAEDIADKTTDEAVASWCDRKESFMCFRNKAIDLYIQECLEDTSESVEVTEDKIKDLARCTRDLFRGRDRRRPRRRND